MKKLLLLTAFFVTSSSFASPLFGSKASFAESSFCKKWSCKFVGSADPDGTNHGKIFTYLLPDGATIGIGRLNNKVVLGFSLINYSGDSASNLISNGGKTPKYFPELAYALTGIKYNANIRADCIDNYDQSGIFFGTDHEIGKYVFGCDMGTNLQTNQPFIGYSIKSK